MEDLISIHAPREGCDHRRRLRLRPQAAISIHAPREGCDGICEFLGVAWRDISIHAPREGCDSERTILIFFCYLFQSTHPARGATVAPDAGGTGHQHFNPRTPRGVRLRPLVSIRSISRYFNPRTPRGVRPASVVSAFCASLFQSTHPARGATGGRWWSHTHRTYFNPRTPRGVRLHLLQGGSITGIISIHAPREGCDGTSDILLLLHRAFQSTHPARGATRRL